jgi:hypothetical protein
MLKMWDHVQCPVCNSYNVQAISGRGRNATKCNVCNQFFRVTQQLTYRFRRHFDPEVLKNRQEWRVFIRDQCVSEEFRETPKGKKVKVPNCWNCRHWNAGLNSYMTCDLPGHPERVL